jgi:hypothetical protein
MDGITGIAAGFNKNETRITVISYDTAEREPEFTVPPNTQRILENVQMVWSWSFVTRSPRPSCRDKKRVAVLLVLLSCTRVNDIILCLLGC